MLLTKTWCLAAVMFDLCCSLISLNWSATGSTNLLSFSAILTSSVSIDLLLLTACLLNGPTAFWDPSWDSLCLHEWIKRHWLNHVWFKIQIISQGYMVKDVTSGKVVLHFVFSTYWHWENWEKSIFHRMGRGCLGRSSAHQFTPEHSPSLYCRTVDWRQC